MLNSHELRGVFMDFSQAIAVLQKGGLVMIPLLACSLLVVAIAVERFFYFRRETTDMAAFMPRIAAAMEKNDWEEAQQVCAATTGCIAAITQAALERRCGGIQVVEKAVEGAAALRAARLRDRLQYLDFVVTLAPLLGLLGTVVGMIQSFSVMNIREGQPFAITGGVGEALIATATGLCVAVLALVVHAYFSQRLDRLITDMEEAGYYLLDRIRGEAIETA